MDHQATITESDLERMLFDKTAEPKPLPFSLLERITNDFSYKMEIGRGGFAVVYKAMLQKGVVAVKKLSNTYMYENEFFREVECLMKVKHKNIVRFLGYCVDTQGHMRMYEGKYVMADIQERLLCFEYLPNGGLDHYIKDPSCGLEWIDRYNIIKGICEGLHHLHERNILHLDLKPANILLDEKMEPKITDFGISRSFEKHQTRVIATKVRGTMGYMAPEFISNVITKKFDLYSIGVIIMEILTGEKRCQGVDSVLKSWSDRLDKSRRNQECEQIRACVEIAIECTNFNEAKRPVNMKHIIERLPDMERIEEILPRIKMLDIGITSSNRSLHSLDTNHTKQWIMTGQDNGHVRIWNYQTQKKVDSFKLSERSKVVCVKFIARKQWFAAASGYNIYVYSYETKIQKITSINAGSSAKSLHTLAVHPTKPYLFSSDYGKIKLWNWEKNWECTHIFGANNSEACIYQIALSSKGNIASASNDCTVKVCSLDSAESNYTLSGHSTSVKCLDFFTWDDQEYLVTGSYDRTAKIWDVEKKMCLCTLQVFMSPVMSVLYRPDLQILITCSQDGSIYLWRICSRIRRRPPKLEQTVSIGGGGVLALACMMGRVAIAKQHAVAIMDINCVNSLEKSTDYTEPQLSPDTRPHQDETSKVIAESIEKLPILDVHPLRLCFHYEPDVSIPCSLQLTNRTDEHVAFRITKESREFLLCSSKLPMYDIVPPRSTYTLDVTTGHKVMLEEETEFNLVVQSSRSGERYITMFISQSECDEFFEEAEEIGNTVHEVTVKAIHKYYNELHPLKHRFYPELSESIPCSLHLTNKTDGRVVFRLMKRRSNSLRWYLTDCMGNAIYGIVPPKSTCTLIGITEEKMLARQTDIHLVLQSISISGDINIMLFEHRLVVAEFFEQAKQLGRTVYEMALKAIYSPRQGETAYEVQQAARPTVMQPPIYLKKHAFLFSMDAHPTEPWIVIGHYNGNVTVWNHESKTTMGLFKISKQPASSIKFHAPKKWIVAVTTDDFIHVYTYVCVTKIQKIKCFSAPNFFGGYSLATHPTKPYLMSASMKLWDGDKGWECTHKFGTGGMIQLVFNPEDPNNFASASVRDHVEVWNLDSPNPDYTLNGHSNRVNCLDFFKRGDKQYLITGSDDCTAKIWDLQTRACIHTLEGIMSPLRHVISIPGRPYIVTCSGNAIVHVWSSTDFRLKKTVNISGGGKVHGLVCLMGSRRIAIGQDYIVSIMDIEDEKVHSEGGNQDSVCTTGCFGYDGSAGGDNGQAGGDGQQGYPGNGAYPNGPKRYPKPATQQGLLGFAHESITSKINKHETLKNPPSKGYGAGASAGMHVAKEAVRAGRHAFSAGFGENQNFMPGGVQQVFNAAAGYAQEYGGRKPPRSYCPRRRGRGYGGAVVVNQQGTGANFQQPLLQNTAQQHGGAPLQLQAAPIQQGMVFGAYSGAVGQQVLPPQQLLAGSLVQPKLQLPVQQTVEVAAMPAPQSALGDVVPSSSMLAESLQKQCQIVNSKEFQM